MQSGLRDLGPPGRAFPRSRLVCRVSPPPLAVDIRVECRPRQLAQALWTIRPRADASPRRCSYSDKAGVFQGFSAWDRGAGGRDRVACYTEMPLLPAYQRIRPVWRYRQHPLEEVWTRAVDTEEGKHHLTIVRHRGTWCQQLPEGRLVPLPGVRDFTVAEYVGNRTRTTHRYGEWIEVPAEVADSVEPLKSWCLRVCNSQLPAGGFRFAPAIWRDRSSDALAVPFVPEFDHPDHTIRALTATERRHRVMATSLKAG